MGVLECEKLYKFLAQRGYKEKKQKEKFRCYGCEGKLAAAFRFLQQQAEREKDITKLLCFIDK